MSDDELLWNTLQERIGYTFKNRSLLRMALSHASGAAHRLESNERLEFLGDAILGCIVCETLYHRFPNCLEGDLTRIKSVVVSRQTCSRLGRDLGLGEALILGRGIRANRIPASVLADAFEAMLAAIYLDGGDQEVRRFVRIHVEEQIDLAVETAAENYKSLLQHVAQRDFGGTPVYRVMAEKGPDHQKAFQIRAIVGEHSFTAAWGFSKKEAEQRAAFNALTELGETIDSSILPTAPQDVEAAEEAASSGEDPV